jgi:TatA/E family protein of Tat protein translocase
MGVDMLFILLLALILFGPKRLPEIARQIGKFVAEFKRASNDFKYQLQAEIDKASPEAPAQRAKYGLAGDPVAPQPSSPSPLLPPAESSPAASAASTQPGGRIEDAESEHERLMRTARMAYAAQSLTLRPPEPPPVARVASQEPTESSPVERSSPADPFPVPSAANSAGDSAAQES